LDKAEQFKHGTIKLMQFIAASYYNDCIKAYQKKEKVEVLNLLYSKSHGIMLIANPSFNFTE
jgi:hypothetical protein